MRTLVRFCGPDFSACLWLVALSRVCLRQCVLRYGDVSYHIMLRACDTYDSCVGHGATWLPEPGSSEPEVPSERSDRNDERKIHSSFFDLSGRLRGQDDIRRTSSRPLDYRQRHGCIAFDSSFGVYAM